MCPPELPITQSPILPCYSHGIGSPHGTSCHTPPRPLNPRRSLNGYMQRHRSPTISEAEKTAITVACQRFIDEFLKPRFLPVICPTEFNYPIDILGKWHGTRYRFIQRYRSGFPENRNEEFDSRS